MLCCIAIVYELWPISRSNLVKLVKVLFGYMLPTFKDDYMNKED